MRRDAHMRSKVAVVGYGRTPYSRAKAGERIYTVDEYLAWAADLALERAGMSKNDFDGQAIGVAHAEASHTVNWSAAVAETLGISPRCLIRADQGGASAAAMLIRASALIAAGIVDRALIMGADTPLTIPSIAPGLPLSPERTRGVFWDFQGPFGVMGANAQFALVQTRYMDKYPLRDEQLGKISVTARYHASLNPGAIYRKPYTMEEYLASERLSWPVRLFDCVPMVNGGLAYIVTRADDAKAITPKPAYLRGFAEVNNYYSGSRTFPDITDTGFLQTAPEAFAMAGIKHADVGSFQPYDDYPMVALIQIEDYGFAKKGEGGKFVDEHDLTIHGDFPMLTDGGQLSGGQPGGAIGGFQPLIEAVSQVRGEAGERQVKKNAGVSVASGFGGMTYARNNRSCATLVFGAEA